MTYYTIILQSILNTLISGIITITTLYIARNKIYDKIQEIITNTIREQIQITLENPHETIQALKPLLNELINELMKETGKNQDYIKIPILGKIPTQLIEPLLQKLLGTNKKQHEENNPFS